MQRKLSSPNTMYFPHHPSRPLLLILAHTDRSDLFLHLVCAIVCRDLLQTLVFHCQTVNKFVKRGILSPETAVTGAQSNV